MPSPRLSVVVTRRLPEAVEARMKDLAGGLARDPQVESVLVGRRRELGLAPGAIPGRDLAQDLTRSLSLGRGLGRDLDR